MELDHFFWEFRKRADWPANALHPQGFLLVLPRPSSFKLGSVLNPERKPHD
jgi:hypothetical protein